MFLVEFDLSMSLRVINECVRCDMNEVGILFPAIEWLLEPTCPYFAIIYFSLKGSIDI